MRPVDNTFIKLSSVTLLTLSMGLAGCQTFKNLTGGKGDDTIETAEKTEQAYYRDALNKIEKGRYAQAVEDLTSLRTFYPTGQYAEQALLDTMYAQYESGEYETAAASAEQFIRLYPSNPQVSYAYYVRGVANMQGATDGLRIFKVNQAVRDTAYMRLAFANFQELVNKYPNSPYAPDAAQRMLFIYNQFAESELNAADWYIEREAYVAAVNRAKWVFQYYPLSESIPEAIAMLAYSHEQLGVDDLAQEYKTLLQLNYPNWLTDDGRVKLTTKRDRSWLSKLTFGKLGRSTIADTSVAPGQFNGATKTQIIRDANQLRLPTRDGVTVADLPQTTSTPNIGGINIGLGLPESQTERVTNQASTGSIAREAVVDPLTTNPTRRTTLPDSRTGNVELPLNNDSEIDDNE